MAEKNRDFTVLQKQAFDFVQLQAEQRLKTFNFYIFLSSALTTGLVTTFKPGPSYPMISLVLSGLLIGFSYIFWKLDLRNRQLIKGAENTLKYFEQTYDLPDEDGVPHIAKKFLREEYDTEKERNDPSISFWHRPLSFSQCFTQVFWVFAILGSLGLIGSLICMAWH